MSNNDTKLKIDDYLLENNPTGYIGLLTDLVKPTKKANQQMKFIIGIIQQLEQTNRQLTSNLKSVQKENESLHRQINNKDTATPSHYKCPICGEELLETVCEVYCKNTNCHFDKVFSEIAWTEIINQYNLEPIRNGGK